MVLTDAEVLKFVAESQALCPESSYTAGIEESRIAYDKMCAFFRAPRPSSVTVKDECTCNVSIRRYRQHATDLREPVVLYLHGGGFVVGSIESHDDICAEICDRTGCEVVAVDYRLAPEHTYPLQLDDIEHVWKALTTQDRPAIVVGDSAGGMLAAALCIRLLRIGAAQPLGQVLIYPALGGSYNLPSYSENEHAPLLSASDVKHYSNLYTSGDDWSRATDPELRPVSCHDVSGLAPAFIVSADLDPLRDDSAEFAKRLQLAGVDAVWRNEPQLVHGFLRARHQSARAKRSFAAILEAILTFSRLRAATPK